MMINWKVILGSTMAYSPKTVFVEAETADEAREKAWKAEPEWRMTQATAIPLDCQQCGEEVDRSVDGDALAEIYNTRTREVKLVHSEPCYNDIQSLDPDWQLA